MANPSPHPPANARFSRGSANYRACKSLLHSDPRGLRIEAPGATIGDAPDAPSILQGDTHVLRRLGQPLARPASGRRPGGGPAALGALLPAPGRPGPPAAAW